MKFERSSKRLGLIVNINVLANKMTFEYNEALFMIYIL